MFVAVNDDVDVLWQEYSLILPAVSIGNVGQLAIDLVLCASSSQLIGYLYDASIVAVVGNDAIAKPGAQCGNLNISTAVYKSEKHRLIILQKRSPVAKGYQSVYCNKLVEWIKCCGYQQIIMLSSISATDRIDSQIKGSPLRYLTSKVTQTLQTKFDNLSWIPFEKKPLLLYSEEHKQDHEQYGYHMPGAGITKRFFETCRQEDIPLTILTIFCSEGDNIDDAVQLFLYVNVWLDIVEQNKVKSKFSGKPSDFVVPLSWSFMFGSPLGEDILF